MAILLSEKNAEILEDTEHARLWDLLIHQERGLANRTNFFLVSESMFVLAYGVVLALAPTKAGIFAIGGLTVSLLWLVLQYKTLSDLSKLSARLHKVELSKHYLAWREECRNFLISHEVIAVVIPALCLTGWFVMLAFVS
jgi:hypothetical protein